MVLPLLAAGSIAGPAVLSALSVLLLALAVWVAARELFDRKVATWAALLLWGSPILVVVGGSPRIDATLTFFLFLAHYAALKETAQTAPGKMLRLSAALVGFGVGIKLLALPFAFTLAPLIVWRLEWNRRGWRESARETTIYALIAALAAAPCLLKNAVLVGTPFYPLSSGARLEPWLAAVAPPGAGDSLAHAAGMVVRGYRHRFNIPDFFLHPWLITPGGAFFGNPAFLLLPLAAFGAWRRRAFFLAGPALVYIAGLLAFGSGYTNLRYLMPAVPQLTVGSAAAVRTGVALIPFRRLRPWAAVLPAALAGLVALAPLWFVAATSALPFALGRVSRADVLEGLPEVANLYRASTWANRMLPRRSRTLMLFESRAFYFRHANLADGLTQNWSVLRTLAQGQDCFGDLGITNMLVNTEMIQYYESRGDDYSAVGWGEFPAYARRCLVPLYRAGGITLYAIRGASAAPTGEPAAAGRDGPRP